MTDTVFLNGRFRTASRARVSAFDRGFLYGDGLFETVRAYRGAVFALDGHLDRLATSAHFLGITVPEIDWRRQIDELLRRNGLRERDAAVRITITRGAGRPGLLPPAHGEPTVLITAASVDTAIGRAQLRGVRVALLPFERDGFLAAHKLLGYVPAILGRLEAARQHAFEALYVGNRNGLSEGTTSNLFLYRDGQLLTPKLGARPDVLPGVTRRLVIRLARSERLSVRERSLGVGDLLAADEAFCTSSVIEIVPIVSVSRPSRGRRATRPDAIIGRGRPGPVTRQLQRLYQGAVALAA
jgi:branched-chain amino acid aminotransferase